MNCRRIQASFDDRLDGRLDPDRQREFDGHVAACAGCRREWTAYSAAWETLGRHETIEASVGFVERTIRRLDEPATTAETFGWRRLPSLRWATLATLAIAILLAGLTGWRHYQTVRQTQVYASAQEADFLGEDLEVIASLDQLDEGNKL